MAGCTDLFEGRVCTAEARAGINVLARDSLSNALISDSIAGFVRDGSYRDTLQPVGIDSLGLFPTRHAAVERAGTYEVHVSRPGYQTWIRTGVVVGRDECHVIPVNLVARMVR